MGVYRVNFLLVLLTVYTVRSSKDLATGLYKCTRLSYDHPMHCHTLSTQVDVVGTQTRQIVTVTRTLFLRREELDGEQQSP